MTEMMVVVTRSTELKPGWTLQIIVNLVDNVRKTIILRFVDGNRLLCSTNKLTKMTGASGILIECQSIDGRVRQKRTRIMAAAL